MAADMADYTLSCEPEPQVYHEKRRLTCRACGATGLVWAKTGHRWRLVGEHDGKLHDCPNRPLPEHETHLETPQHRPVPELADMIDKAVLVRVYFPRRKIRPTLRKQDLLDRLADHTQGPRLIRAFKTALNTRTGVLSLITHDTTCVPIGERLDTVQLRSMAHSATRVRLYFAQTTLYLTLDKHDLLKRLADESQGEHIAAAFGAGLNARTQVLTLTARDVDFRV